MRISVAAGAEISVDEGCWLHTVVEPIHLVAYEGARLHVGPRTFLNGCLLSAKSEVELGESALIGSGTRLYDADQHPVDDVTPERADPIRIGHDVWLASDVTVLRGVEIGPNTIVGARSVVTQSIPEHSLAVGAPARPVGRIGDRSKVRVL